MRSTCACLSCFIFASFFDACSVMVHDTLSMASPLKELHYLSQKVFFLVNQKVNLDDQTKSLGVPK